MRMLLQKKWAWATCWFLALLITAPMLFGCFWMMGPVGPMKPSPKYDSGYTVKMRVVDIETGEPLQNIRVHVSGFIFTKKAGLKSRSEPYKSDADGFLTLNLPENGEVKWRVYDQSLTYHVSFLDNDMQGSLASYSRGQDNDVPGWMKPVSKDGELYWEIPLFKMRKIQETVIPASALNHGQAFMVVYRSVGMQDAVTKRVPDKPEVIVHESHEILGPHIEVRYHFADWIRPLLQLPNGEKVPVTRPSKILSENTEENLKNNPIGLWELYHPEDSKTYGYFGGNLTYYGGRNSLGNSQRVPYYYGHYKDALRLSRYLAEYEYYTGYYDEMQKDARALFELEDQKKSTD